MSLPTTKPGTNTYPLYGIDEISLPKNSLLIFSHPSVKKNGKANPLYIYSGAMAIQWAYTLNTQSTPTIGGEVVQVLSCSAGPMSISGQTAGLATNKNAVLDKKFIRGWETKGQQEPYTPNHELFAITAWFREYMEHAGANTFGNVRRDERAIRFKYPERGWDFWIQVTGLKGFRYDKAVISPQWSITAEIVTDNALDYFEGLTMNSFQDDLLSNITLMGEIGLSPFAVSGTETSNGAFGNTGDLGSQDPFLNPAIGTSLVDPKQIGNNFQTLVAAWTGGNTDFLNGVFSALADNATNPQSTDSVYKNLFGADFLGNPPGPNATTGSGSGSGLGSVLVGAGAGSNPSTSVVSYSSPSDIAYAISVAFQAVGIPGYVGVAAALQESGLNPDRTQDACTSANCGIGLFQVNGDGTGRDSSAAVKQAGQNRVYESTQGNITPYYPASMQIAAAAKWFGSYVDQINFNTASPLEIGEWIRMVQGADPNGNYPEEVSAKFSQAKQLIGDGATRAASLNQQTLSGTRATVVNWAKQFVQKYQGTYSENCRRDVENITPGDYSALPTSDCSNTVALLYCWGTGDDRRYGTNGTSFNDSNTATMWNTCTEIPSSQARAGDLVIWGNGGNGVSNPQGSNHVALLVEDYHGDTTQVFSFGANPPTIGDISFQSDYQNQRGYGTHYFRRLPV